MSDIIGMTSQPSRACFFEPGVEHVAVAGFNHAGADRQSQSVGLGIIQAIHSIAQIAMAAANGRFFIGHFHGLQTLGQCFDHFFRSAAAQSLLLGAAPAIRLAGGADGCGGSEIFAHVKKIAQKMPLLSKDFLGLKPNPFGSIADHMNATV